MNPARDLGPRLVTLCTGWGSAALSSWWLHTLGIGIGFRFGLDLPTPTPAPIPNPNILTRWVYTLGPLAGAVIGGKAYQLLASTKTDGRK
jgi:glycerol uptake facilitator-like aquaporin